MRYREDEILTEEELAGLLITSKEAAEDFIKRYMEVNNVDRKTADAKLKKWGIESSRLPAEN